STWHLPGLRLCHRWWSAYRSLRRSCCRRRPTASRRCFPQGGTAGRLCWSELASLSRRWDDLQQGVAVGGQIKLAIIAVHDRADLAQIGGVAQGREAGGIGRVRVTDLLDLEHLGRLIATLVERPHGAVWIELAEKVRPIQLGDGAAAIHGAADDGHDQVRDPALTAVRQIEDGFAARAPRTQRRIAGALLGRILLRALERRPSEVRSWRARRGEGDRIVAPLAHFADVQVTGGRVEAEAERIAQAIVVDARVAVFGKRVALRGVRSRLVGIEAQHLAVRRAHVLRHPRSRRVTVAAAIAHADVEHPIGTEQRRAGIVVLGVAEGVALDVALAAWLQVENDPA